MQAQINPHFLFNTLNSISRLALQAKDMEVVDLIEALSQMLRYNLNHINRAITLREEIENMKNYIHIQEIRFKDKLGFIIENHSGRMELQMPCMTLQPIVENAIVHGLKPYNYEGAVTVAITDQEEYTLVSIQDDGIGMEKQDIRRMILGKPEQGEHTSIGFQNVMARLNTFFGREDCVNAVSELGGGTEITLKLYCKRSTPHV
jgi:sensor histidine kinase YesM